MDSAELIEQAVNVVVASLAAPPSAGPDRGRAVTEADRGRAVTDVVSGLLEASAPGRQVLAAVSADPGDADAVAALTRVLTERVEESGAAAALAAALDEEVPAPPASPGQPPGTSVGGSVHISIGGDAKKSPISIGPMTFERSTSGRLAMVAVLVLLIGAFAFVGDKGRALWNDSSPHADSADGPVSSADPRHSADPSDRGASVPRGNPPADAVRRETPLNQAESLKAVLPPLTGLPAGWTEVSAPSVGASTLNDGSTFTATSEYTGVYEMDTFLYAYSYPTSAQAGAALGRQKKQAVDDEDKTLTMPAIGDESFAWSVDYGNHTRNCILVRTATVLTADCGNDDVDDFFKPNEINALQSLAQLLSDRADAAQTV
ncbi:hypothetical protein [Streptomyces sp. NBC_01477]|uniref:hypothetical protein n=1 Tax=Streptomyces sp. NBC_01477 TaxID=2976015 RepID=UPI002E2F2667|nr:hypothetical protein [Streptomyces sp. NBC_01477]